MGTTPTLPEKAEPVVFEKLDEITPFDKHAQPQPVFVQAMHFPGASLFRVPGKQASFAHSVTKHLPAFFQIPSFSNNLGPFDQLPHIP